MSFNSDMTNLANAIRTKAGVTGGLTVSAMTTAVNGIVINTGSDIDLTGVNVTADKLLSGIVALDASGEKVTGNIATVTPSISANVFTVRKGYVAQDAELTVPEAAVTETDSSVTIGVGYVSEELTYDLGSGGSDIDFTGVNVTADKLLDGTIAIDANGEKVTGYLQTVTAYKDGINVVVPSGYIAQQQVISMYDFDLSGVNVTANNLLEGIVAIGHDGGKVTGRLPYSTPRRDGSSVIVPQGYVDRQYTFEQMQVGYDTSEVTASFYNMLLGTIAVGPAGERIEGGIPTLTTDSISVSNGVVFVTGPGYISDDGVAGLRYELPESTVTTTDTTLTATVGYLKEPINFTTSGTGGGSGSGAFDLAKVTEYTPYAPALSAVTSVAVSGMGTFGDGEEDVSDANGTYLVTAETATESDWQKRVYKHESADYYLHYYEDPDYPEDAYWQFGYDTDSGFMSLSSSENIASGENDWENWDWGETFTLTLDVTTTTTPETPMVLKGVLATGYTDGEWSFADSEQNFTGFENTPKKSCVYAVSGNKLIGSAVDLAGMYPGDAILSNCDSLTDTYMRYTNCELSTDVKKFGSGSIKINSNGYIKFNHGKTSLVNIPWTAAHFFYADSYTGGTDLKPLINNDTDAGGTFFIAITSGGKIRTHIRGGSYSDTQDTLSSGWHHIRAVQYGGTLKAYLDGNLIATVTTFSANTDSLWIGKLAAASSRQFEGYIDGIEFFEIPANRLDLYTGDTAPVPDKEFEI